MGHRTCRLAEAEIPPRRCGHCLSPPLVAFPSFQRRGGRAAAGVVSKRSRSLLISFEITNHPVCAAKERDLFINGAATPPLKGGDSSLSIWGVRKDEAR